MKYDDLRTAAGKVLHQASALQNLLNLQSEYPNDTALAAQVSDSQAYFGMLVDELRSVLSGPRGLEPSEAALKLAEWNRQNRPLRQR